jgi:HAE1 family hydrophobic/amphiphilic exporter-1
MTGVPADGFSSTEALDALEATAKEVLPADMGFDWADMSYQERKAPGVAVVFLLAVFLVFLILAAQYESWGLPFSVLLGTPFAAFGAYLGTLAGAHVPGTELREQHLRADRFDHAHRPGGEERDSDRRIREDGVRPGQTADRGDAERREAALPADSDDRLRLHPWRRAVLTATGAGAEARKVMGMTVFSGMLVATFLGVLLIPMLFVAVQKVIGASSPWRRRRRHWRRTRPRRTLT